jgi:hypothetical protein
LYTRERRWVAKITADGGTKTPGCFTDETQAPRAYDSAAKIYHGDSAALNFPDSKG